MRKTSRVIIIAALSWFAWVLLQNVRTVQTMDENGIAIPDAQMKVILYFGGIILVATGIGVFAALEIVPILGDKIAGYFLNLSNEEIEPDPHAVALECLANENYGEAIKEYFKAYAKNPQDVYALSEIAHSYCDHLQDSAAGSSTLEEALKREWPERESVFLQNRLVDIYWDHQHDAVRARYLLMKIAEAHPATRHAANARKRLLEIES